MSARGGHAVEVIRMGRSYRLALYGARCSCGWSAAPRRDREKAWKDARDHELIQRGLIRNPEGVR